MFRNLQNKINNFLEFSRGYNQEKRVKLLLLVDHNNSNNANLLTSWSRSVFFLAEKKIIALFCDYSSRWLFNIYPWPGV